jgi:uncharacterized protein DUF4136
MAGNNWWRQTLRFAAIGVCLILATTMAIARVKVQSQRDPGFDFARLKTWAWNPSSPGEIKMVGTSLRDPETVQRQYQPVITQAIEEEFVRRGYAKATGSPDFYATYYVLITMGSASQYAGQFLPTNAQWGIPLFAPSTINLTVYPQGTLVLDAASPAPDRVIWRGMAEAQIEVQNTEAKRTARIKGIAKDLLAKFPKK